MICRLLGLLGAAWVALAGCAKPPEAPAAPSGRTAAVELLRIEPEQVQPTLTKTVTIRSRVDQVISAESSGVVRRRLLREGTRAEAGAALLELDAAVEAAAAAAAEAEFLRVVTSGGSAAAREAAQARRIEAQDRHQKRTVRAPLACRLETWLVQEGAFVNPGTPVARILEPERLFAVASLLEEEIGLVTPGLECRLESPIRPAAPPAVRVCRLGAAPSATAGRYDVEVEWEGTGGLLPGMVATLHLPVGAPRAELRIPAAAVRSEFGAPAVWLATESTAGLVAATRIVQTSPVLGRADLVSVSEGLSAGDRIVIRGSLGLREGDALRAEPTPP